MTRTSIRGTILASEGDGEWVCADVVARSDGGSPHRYALRRSFTIRAEDDGHHRVIPTEAELQGGRKESKRGTWASLSGTPFARLAEGFNAGAHVRVEIEVRGFRVGDTVTIDGQVRDAPRTEPTDYRGHAPGRRVPAVVEARRIREAKVSRAPEPPPAHVPRACLSAPRPPWFSAPLS